VAEDSVVQAVVADGGRKKEEEENLQGEIDKLINQENIIVRSLCLI
jgi:hypothetical protein